MGGGREAILSAAIRVFAEKGYAGASTREICLEAGITKPVLYYHFRGKEEVFREIMVESFGVYRRRLLRAAGGRGTPRERLQRLLWAGFQEARRDPVRLRFILRAGFSPEKEHPFYDFVHEMEIQRELITQVFRDAVRDGQTRGDPSEMATALMGIELMFEIEFLFTGRATLTRSRAARIVAMLLGRRG